jgi:hypothetical protein
LFSLRIGNVVTKNIKLFTLNISGFMAKENEIDYIRQVARIEDVPLEQFRKYLANKPFSDSRCGE